MINLLEDPLPKPLIWIGVPIAAFIPLVFFSFLRSLRRFPISWEVESALVSPELHFFATC